MLTPLTGIHHVTAITSNAQQNVDFYTGTLGLRLVKVTINYDDPQSYHLYYGDALGRPGTAMTFFVWPGRRGSAGTGQVTETAFAIPAGARDYWQTRLANHNPQPLTRMGEKVLLFADPDGMPLALVETTVSDTHLWPHGGVPAQYAIRGFHGVTLSETDELFPRNILTRRFGFQEIARESNRVRFASTGDVARFVDVLAPVARAMPHGGVGQVHHVAFRTPTDEQQAEWLATLQSDGHNVSPIMDRDYFHSIYFREPGGVLFEIATDGPGMTHNDAPETLGTHLALPAWLEPHRAAIQAGLPPLKLPEPVAA